MHINRECHCDIFTQIDSLVISCRSIELYTIDFVRYILERRQYPIVNIFLALEKAKFAQIYALDLSLWFTTDNELVASDSSMNRLTQPSSPVSTKKRLAFSNRIISPN